MMFLRIIVLVGMTVCVYSETCPSYEDMRPCYCENMRDTGNILVACTNEDDDLQLDDLLAQPIKSLKGKKKVEIHIDGFDLSHLPLNFFEGIEVKRLDIYNSKVLSVTEDDQVVLLGLENSLEELVIERTISESNDHSKLKFGHLRKLKKLDFSFNSIKDLTNSWFENSTLEDITLMDNEIEILGDKSFASLSNLKTLILSGNKFSSVKRSMFPTSADHLEGLHLDENALTSLPEDIFTNMPSLTKLSLSSNQFTTLDQTTWEPVWEELDYLYIDDNPLQCDSDLNWTFDLMAPHFLLGTCDAPSEENGKSLRDFIDNKGQ